METFGGFEFGSVTWNIIGFFTPNVESASNGLFGIAGLKEGTHFSPLDFVPGEQVGAHLTRESLTISNPSGHDGDFGSPIVSLATWLREYPTGNPSFGTHVTGPIP
jgi:hypothetical protein